MLQDPYLPVSYDQLLIHIRQLEERNHLLKMIKRLIAAGMAVVLLCSCVPAFAIDAAGESTARVSSNTVSATAVLGRERLNFNQGWKFIRRDIPNATGVDYPLEQLEGWESVNLPHTVRVEPYNTSGNINYQGQAMYRKHFTVPAAYIGKKVYIEFEAAMGVSDIWVNGDHLQTKVAAKTGNNTHYGGYLPIILDLTDHIHEGEDNVIVVRVDNSDNINVPPGKPQGGLDFTYMGGIYRNAWIDVVYPVHITNSNFEDIVSGGGILVDYPAVSKSEATVIVETHIRNELSTEQTVTLTSDIVDRDDANVATGAETVTIAANSDHTFEQTLTVTNPKLWDLDNPYLHTLRSTVKIDGKNVDEQETSIGIRRIELSAGGVTINGEQADFLSGVNRHQEYPYLGFAASSSLQRKDAIKFKSAGFNFVRTAHHPQSTDFLAACDELGLVVMESVPGWQHWSSAPEFATRVKEDIRQMIRRDRNHPSILTFEISLNESPAVPQGFINECDGIAKQEHPSLRTSAENPHNGANSDVLYGTPSEVAGWSPTACGVIREYADLWEEQNATEGNGKFETECRVTRGPGTFYPGGEARMVNQANRALWLGYRPFGTGSLSLAQGIKHYQDTNGRFIGINKWIGIDHNRGYHKTMSPCGIWDLMRLPKYMYYAYASQRPLETNAYLESQSVATGPSLFIASSWSETAPVLDKSGGRTLGTDDKRMIYVYSNAPKIKLSVMDTSGNEQWSATQAPATRDNANLLAHAPFEFVDVPYTAGSYLKAEGLDAQNSALNPVMTQELHTAGAPAQLMLEVDDEGMQLIADGSDAVMVFAYVTDAQGNICQTANNELTFSVTGSASIVGDGDRRVGANPIQAEAGATGVYIQSGMEADEIQVTVSSDGLQSDTVTFNSVGMTRASVPYTKIKDGPPLDSASMYLTEMETKGEQIGDADPTGFTAGSVQVGGVSYDHSITVPNMSPIRYQLDDNYGKLSGSLALKNPAKSNGTTFKVYLDGSLAYSKKITGSAAVPLDLNITGAHELILMAEDPTLINASEAYWLSLYLTEGSIAPDESELRQNLSVGKTITATTSGSDTGANLANDGNAATAWKSADAVAGGAPQSLTIDLGELTNIRNTRVGLLHDYFLYTYEVQTSADAQTWDTKKTTSKTGHASNDLDEFISEGVRYVRIQFTEIKSTQGEGVGPLVADVTELEIYKDMGVQSVTEYQLGGLVIAGQDMAFDAAKTDYQLQMPGFKINTLYMKAMPKTRGATVTINGETVPSAENLRTEPFRPYALRDGKLEIVVTTPKNASKTYTVTVNGGNTNTFDAHRASVPEMNGVNHWSYGSITGDQHTVFQDDRIVKNEYTWGSDWLYSGPRYMHPSGNQNTTSVRTFTAPLDGQIALSFHAEKFVGQDGKVALSVYQNNQKVWPADQASQAFGKGEAVNESLNLSVRQGDTLQFRLNCSTDGNGGDGTGLLTSVTYESREKVNLASLKVNGEALTAKLGTNIYSASVAVDTEKTLVEAVAENEAALITIRKGESSVEGIGKIALENAAL